MSDNSFDIGKAAKNLHDLQKVGEAMGLAAGQRAEGAEAGDAAQSEWEQGAGAVSSGFGSTPAPTMRRAALSEIPGWMLNDGITEMEVEVPAAPPVAEKTELGQAGRREGEPQ